MPTIGSVIVDPVTGKQKIVAKGLPSNIQLRDKEWDMPSGSDVTMDDLNRWGDQIVEMNNPSPRSPLASGVDPNQEIARSDALTRATEGTDIRQVDPALSWFNYGLMNPEVERYQRDVLGSDKRFEEEFARQMSLQDPQTLEDYVKLGDRFIKAEPYLAPMIKKRMMQMPQHIKMEYDARVKKAATQKANDEALEESLRMIKRYQEAGVNFKTGEPLDSVKEQRARSDFRRAKRKERLELLDKINANQKIVDDRDALDGQKNRARWYIKLAEQELAELDNEMQDADVESVAPASSGASSYKMGSSMGADVERGKQTVNRWKAR